MADVEYLRKKKNDIEQLLILNKTDNTTIVLDYIKENPFSTSEELKRKFGVYVKNFKEVYDFLGIEYVKNFEKRRYNKKMKIINYIKKNHNATQWEINKYCKTHVQDLFRNGIIGAFEEANIPYPYERRIKYGTAIDKIRNRADDFEKEIVDIFRNFGNVRYQVKTKNGIADALVEINGKEYVVEVKDYRTKPVSYCDAKQLNKYLNSLNCKKGILVCNFKKRDKFYI